MKKSSECFCKKSNFTFEGRSVFLVMLNISIFANQLLKVFNHLAKILNQDITWRINNISIFHPKKIKHPTTNHKILLSPPTFKINHSTTSVIKSNWNEKYTHIFSLMNSIYSTNIFNNKNNIGIFSNWNVYNNNIKFFSFKIK